MQEKICKFYCYKKTRDKNNLNLKMDKLELAVFDMDGVLLDIISSWKYIHDHFNTSNEESVDLYVKGKIDDKEFIRRDAELWKVDGKPLKEEILEEILKEVPIMNGAKETISFLKENGIKTAIVSAGLDILANRLAEDLGIDFVYSNGIKTDSKGYLNGEGIVGVKLRFKDETIVAISKKHGIQLNRIATVGNSCFDIPMFWVSGLGVAFNPDDDCVCNAADFVVNEKDLTKTLPIFEKHF